MSSFNPDLQFKDTKSVIRNRLAGLLTEFKEIKFVRVLVLEYEKIESYDKAKCTTFCWSQRFKDALMKSILILRHSKVSNK